MKVSDPGSYNYDLIKARYYEIEFHRRFALPTACLVLAMVGIPLGLSARKGGKSTGFVLTILLVVVYYFFSMIGVQMARQGKMSPWFGAWMGNIFFFVCGLILLWRVDRMPIEIANLTAGWKPLLQKLQSLGARRRQFASARASAESSQHRRRFSARFPLILDDMILRDFALYLTLILATFLVLALVFTFFELLTDIVRNKVPVVMLAEYLWNLSPSLIYLMAPMAVLLAVLITFGLMEKSSELIAMKASGFSIYRATLPVIVISGLFAVRLVYFRSGLHSTHEPPAGNPAQRNQGQTAADLSSSRSQMDFWSKQRNLLLPAYSIRTSILLGESRSSSLTRTRFS